MGLFHICLGNKVSYILDVYRDKNMGWYEIKPSIKLRASKVPTHVYILISLEYGVLFLILTFVANYDDTIAQYIPLSNDKERRL